MAEPFRMAWGGTVAHVRREHNDNVALCGRSLVGAPNASIGVKTCQRCQKKYDQRQESKAKWNDRLDAARERREANRAGRFVIYRCRTCGLQHNPPTHGVAFCLVDHHEADLEVVEVSGPAFVVPSSAKDRPGAA